MLSLGLDLSERPVRAVVVTDSGEVVGRATADNGDEAVRAAASGHAIEVGGIAVLDVKVGKNGKDGRDVTIPGVKRAERCSPGAAAMAAEAWLGAAKGVRHAICLHIGDEIYAGLDLRMEINSIDSQRLGDTILTYDGSSLAGFANCHCGAGTETSSGNCYVKFGAARLGSARHFDGLLDA